MNNRPGEAQMCPTCLSEEKSLLLWPCNRGNHSSDVHPWHSRPAAVEEPLSLEQQANKFWEKQSRGSGAASPPVAGTTQKE